MSLPFDSSNKLFYGLTYYTVLNLSVIPFYLITAIVWFGYSFGHRQLTRTITLYGALSTLLLTVLFQQFTSAISNVLNDIYSVYAVNMVALFIANMAFLWSVSLFYMILLMIAKGWCITHLDISNSAKQHVILIGAAMMLIELLLSTAFQIQSLFLVLGYVMVYQIFRLDVRAELSYIHRQVNRLTLRGEIGAPLLIPWKKKLHLLRNFTILVSIYLTLQIIITIMRVEVDPFIVTIIQKSIHFLTLVTLLYLFRIREPHKIYLSINQNGRLILSNVQSAVNSTVQDINESQSYTHNFIVVRPWEDGHAQIDLAVPYFTQNENKL